jgi:hypothetical protein
MAGNPVVFVAQDREILPRTKIPYIVGEDGRAVCLPPEVLVAGNAKLTSAIWEQAHNHPTQLRHEQGKSGRDRQYREILAAIARVCLLSDPRSGRWTEG